MADVSVVSTKLEQIDQYHSEPRSMQDVARSEFLEDVTRQRAVERTFENAIQACADLAKHLATEDFGRGDASWEAVLVLAENDVVDDATTSTLADAVGFRNFFAHE